MSKKIILFLMLALFGSTSFLRADVVTIGDPAGEDISADIPTNSFYKYSLTQQIYTAEEIGISGTINSFSMFFCTSGGTVPARSVNVFMKEVDKAGFTGSTNSSTDWVTMADSDLVFTGEIPSMSGVTATEVTFTLNTPFEYTGEGNLLICFQDVTGSYTSGLRSVVFGSYENPYYSIYVRRDGSSYDPTNPTQYSGYLNFLKSVVVLDMETAPAPIGELAIIPNNFDLGERAINAWMEPFNAMISNGGEETSVTVSLSNTTGVNPFSLSQEINNVTLATGENLEFSVYTSTSIADGVYTEELTMFYFGRDIMTLPVTAAMYTAGVADAVETAKVVSAAGFSENPTGMHANYMLPGMTEMTTDAVYKFTLSKDSYFSATSESIIAIYKYMPNLHLTADVEPVVMVENGEINDEVLLAGTYYMVVADANLATATGSATEIAAPTAITYIAPENYATNVQNPVLTWEGGENATQYQVLFGTSPANMPVVLDWTSTNDGNYGTFDASSLVTPNTQYFWQVKAKNSNGVVTGGRWGFTTTLIAPNNVTVSENEIFTDESTLVKWRLAGTGGFEGEVTVCDGTTTNSYVPVYGLWVDSYTRSEMVYPAEMLEEMQGGEINSVKYYIGTPAASSWGAATFKVYVMEVDNATLSSYYGSTNATVVYTGALDGTSATMTINFTTPYEYEGGNLLIGIEQLTTGTYKTCYFTGVSSTGSSASGYSSTSVANASFIQRDFLPKTTFVCGARNNNRGLLGFNVYYDDVKANTSLITANSYLLSNLPYNVDGYNVSVTAVYNEGESNNSEGVTVRVSGYGTFTGQVTELISGDPMSGVTVTFAGRDEFNNAVEFSGTTNSNGIYNITAKAGNYLGTATLEGFEPRYSDGNVALEYNGTTSVNFVIHELYNPVGGVIAEDMTTLANVKWSLGHISGGGSGDEFTESWDEGLNGWTLIDNNNDGHTWYHSTEAGNHSTLAVTSHSGAGHLMGESYCNATWAAITPDDYVVSPQQYGIANGSTISVWACAQDVSYPAEHFGFAISTGSNTSAADFTTIAEWTLTAKGAGDPINGRDGKGTREGNWYNFSADLSAYAGQNVWIAVRHFGCNDQFIIDIDDIELSVGRGSRDVHHYTVYRKAILKETALTPADSVLLADNVMDTNYADFGWNSVEPGLYQYGVSAVYPMPDRNNRVGDELTVYDGTETNGYVPVYGFYADAYLKCQYVMPAGELADMANGTINGMTFYLNSTSAISWGSANFQVYMTEVGYTEISAFIDPSTATMVYEGSLSAADGTMVVTFDTPYIYNGGNLLIGFDNTVKGTYVSSYFYGEAVTGACVQGYDYNSISGVTPTQRNFLPKTTFSYDAAGGGSGNDNPVTPITWSNVLPKDIETTVVVNAQVSTGSVEGTMLKLSNLFENIEYIEEFDETGSITIENFRKGEYTLTVELDGYVSNYVETEVSIWNETEFNAYLTENFMPVEEMIVSGTGYAMWTNMLPEDRMAEKYQVMLNNVYQGETTDNYMQLDVTGLTVGETYTAKVAVVYTTGMSAWVETQFTYIDCSSVAQQVEELDGYASCMDIVLSWNGGTPTPPTPPTPPTGDVTVILTAGDIWGDGSGYQMLLDADATAYGSIIPTTGALSTNCTGNESIYAEFEYKIPTNADGNCSTSNIVLNNSVSITIPAGTYDWCITNPTPGDRIWIAAANGNVGGRQDNYVFEGGKIYEFTISMFGSNDGVNVTITDAKGVAKPQYDVVAQGEGDVRVMSEGRQSDFEAATFMNAGYAKAGSVDADRDGNWYGYDNNNANEDAIGTGGGNFWWGIMFPAGTLEGNTITKVAAYDYMYMTGTVTVYQGGTSAPGTELGSANVTFTGTNQYLETEFSEPIVVDPAQNVWVIYYNGSAATYPAAVCANTGNPNGRWVSLDGSSWADLVSYSLDHTFMLRAYVEQGGGAGGSSIVPGKFNIFADGEFVGATSDSYYTLTADDTEEHLYEVYYVDANYNFSCAAGIEVAAGVLPAPENIEWVETAQNGESGILFTWDAVVGATEYIVAIDGTVLGSTDETGVFITGFQPGTHTFGVSATNGECESEMVEIEVTYTSVSENEIVNAIYPNPTSGDLYINATAMNNISVYNAMGQMVYNQDVDADEMVIDMSQFEAGVYMVNIITENGSSVKRITVIK